VAELLSSFRSLPGHVFWPDDISLLDHQHLNTARLLDSAHVTDSYLLALARAHHGQLATFDQRMPVESVVDGAKALHLIQ
jgi:predicted nucleic acid-binding protein